MSCLYGALESRRSMQAASLWHELWVLPAQCEATKLLTATSNTTTKMPATLSMRI